MNMCHQFKEPAEENNFCFSTSWWRNSLEHLGLFGKKGFYLFVLLKFYLCLPQETLVHEGLTT